MTGLPAAFMYVMSTWALVLIIRGSYDPQSLWRPVPIVGVVLLTLAAAMLIEAAWVLLRPSVLPPPSPRAHLGTDAASPG
jgi:hypothetical protein